MKGKSSWLILSWLMVLSLVLVACAPKAPAEVAPTPKETAPVAPTAPAAPAEVAAPVTEQTGYGYVFSQEELTEKPRYGGTAIISLFRDVQGFDRTLQTTATWHINHNLVYDELVGPDLTMGPLGTREADFTNTGFGSQGILTSTGWLAESWEIPDKQTVLFKIRKGVRWHNKPPVNGRELTASDVVFSLKREYGFDPKFPKPYNVLNAPFGLKVTDVYVAPDDPWKVVFKVPDYAPAWMEDVAEKLWIWPRESIEKYGDLKDWRNALGTGPFMLTDYVPNSSLSFVKNPDWWFKNPVGPGKGDQLPYLDKVTALVIPDLSTAVSALRTGKIDTMAGGRAMTTGGWALEWEDLEGLLKTNPKIRYKQLGAGQRIALGVRTNATDPRAAPLVNQKVRWAMAMAIDREALARDFYQSKAGDPKDLEFGFPKGSPYHSTYDQMVEILQRVHGLPPAEAQMVKKILEYHPEDAKKLLAEAGYPNGFKTTVMSEAGDVDMFSIVAGYLKKNLNIDLDIDVKEAGIYSSTLTNHTFPAMVGRGGSLGVGRPERWLMWLPGKKDAPFAATNYLEFYNPVVEKGILGTFDNFGDIPKRSQIMQETIPYAIWLGWSIYVPDSYTYNVWQPWLKLYSGETAFGMMNHFKWISWSWLDQEVKAKITGKK